jgi:hypothetical protein
MKQNPIPKVIALILITTGLAWLMNLLDAAALSKIDSTSAADYIQHQREIHSHSYVEHFIFLLIFGGFYIGAVEFISYLIAQSFPKNPMSGSARADIKAES